jgi:hypothetical protein
LEEKVGDLRRVSTDTKTFENVLKSLKYGGNWKIEDQPYAHALYKRLGLEEVLRRHEKPFNCDAGLT